MKREPPREISGIELDVDWNRRCAICFRKPTVLGRQHDRVVYSGHLCGVCLWGDRTEHEPDESDARPEE